MPPKPLEIGSLSFAKKGDATEHFRQILYRHEVGSVIPEPDATHVYWLLERHPEATKKIGAGVKELSTRDAMFNTRCFEIRRMDGTATDFSIKSCIDGKAPTVFSEVLRALRMEVAEETKQMKWGFFRESTNPDGKVPCALTGRLLTLDEAVIDHNPPNTFKALAQRFLGKEGIVPTAALVTPSEDNQYTPRLIDRGLGKRWQDFYRANATVRVVAK